nr:hypothetical protein [Tanacetum cinerariifolium]
MPSITDQQAKLDLELKLVSKEKILKIGNCNGKLNPGKIQREPIFQIVLDALALTPCYSAFLITADVSEVYTHQFWDSVYKHDTFYRFKMDKRKRFKITLEIFKDIIKICPRVQGQDFDALLLAVFLVKERVATDVKEKVPSFLLTDDPLKRLNKAMTLFRSATTSRYPLATIQEGKVSMGKALVVSLVVTKSSEIDSENQDTSSRSGYDADADNADIRPIYDKEPMAKVQLTAECNIFATGQQHVEQPEITTEGSVD